MKTHEEILREEQGYTWEQFHKELERFESKIDGWWYDPKEIKDPILIRCKGHMPYVAEAHKYFDPAKNRRIQ